MDIKDDQNEEANRGQERMSVHFATKMFQQSANSATVIDMNKENEEHLMTAGYSVEDIGRRFRGIQRPL